MDTASKTATYYTNQDVMNELSTYAEQFCESTKEYNEALDNYNEAINSYNDFIYDYSEMSYFQQRSSITVNRKSVLKSECKKYARADIVQCEVMEAQIEDMFIFMEANKEVLMNLDSKGYFEIKSGLTETKASIKLNKATTEKVLSEYFVHHSYMD